MIRGSSRSKSQRNILAFLILIVLLIGGGFSFGLLKTVNVDQDDYSVELIQKTKRDNPRSLEEVTKSLSAELLSKFNPRLEKFWFCGVVEEVQKKLIFVHVFKTAGSSFRGFFRQYAGHCRKGIAVLIGCSNMKPPVSPTDVWTPCELKDAYNRQHELVAQRYHNMTYQSLPQYETDILIGHLPIGLHPDWLESNQQPILPQYITFFRHPVSKFVSGEVYENKDRNWTHAQALDHIQTKVYKDTSEGLTYNAYARYLLTPHQHHPKRSEQDQTLLVLQNLVEFPVVIGVVERMAESIKLMAYTLQADRSTKKILNKMTYKKRANASPLSTSGLVADLEKDGVFMERLTRYLRYEFVLYEFALRLHERQYEWLLQHQQQQQQQQQQQEG